MNDAALVSMLQPDGDLARKPACCSNGEWVSTIDVIIQIRSFNQLRNQKKKITCLFCIKDGDNVRMTKLRRGPDFAKKPLHEVG